jgi:5-methylcytosine-specific restriction endonuclease McrA
MNELKTNGCAICGYNKCSYALDFHHINPKTKKFNITTTSLISFGLEKILIEMNKCVLLCSNCHDEIEWGN